MDNMLLCKGPNVPSNLAVPKTGLELNAVPLKSEQYIFFNLTPIIAITYLKHSLKYLHEDEHFLSEPFGRLNTPNYELCSFRLDTICLLPVGILALGRMQM